MTHDDAIDLDIPMVEVESSQLHSIGHDPETDTLAIRFKAKGGLGSLYHYTGFTAEDFTEFQAAESKGSHFIKRIKPHGDRWPFRKVAGVGE